MGGYVCMCLCVYVCCARASGGTSDILDFAGGRLLHEKSHVTHVSRQVHWRRGKLVQHCFLSIFAEFEILSRQFSLASPVKGEGHDHVDVVRGSDTVPFASGTSLLLFKRSLGTFKGFFGSFADLG